MGERESLRDKLRRVTIESGIGMDMNPGWRLEKHILSLATRIPPKLETLSSVVLTAESTVLIAVPGDVQEGLGNVPVYGDVVSLLSAGDLRKAAVGLTIMSG